MKSPHIQATLRVSVTTIIFALLLGIFVLPRTAQAQGTATSAYTADLDAGDIIIPMDNRKQGADGNCNGPLFNLKAYGLVARLLHNNIAVEWVIDTDTTRDDNDFTTASTRYQGTYPISGGSARGNYSATQSCQDTTTATDDANNGFSGGPFVIRPTTAAQGHAILDIIDAFNAEITDTTPFNVGTGVQNRVRVFIKTGTTTTGLPVRYNIMHKPYIAVGPDQIQGGGQTQGFRQKVHQRLFDYAKLAANKCPDNAWDPDTADSNVNWSMCTNANYQPYYSPVPNDLVQASSCFTMATQAHAESDIGSNLVNYQNFAKNGGNMLFQCRSIEVFENTLNGHFQTNSDWSLATSSGTIGAVLTNYPNPWQPYKQFVGNLANSQTGTVGAFNGGSPLLPAAGNFRQSVTNNSSQYVASVGNIADFFDPNPAVGGHVFELGGHDYFQLDTGRIPYPDGCNVSPAKAGCGGVTNDPMDIEHINGQRMILNAAFVPVVRTGCDLAIPQVAGRKQVVLETDNAPVGFISPGDVATWTIRYINIGDAPVTNFQIVDALDGSQNPAGFGPAGTYVPGSLELVNAINSTVTLNEFPPVTGPGGFNGISDKNVLDPASPRTLGVNGLITVRLKTTLTAYNTAYFNRPVATGDNIEDGGPGDGVPTDTVDFGQNAVVFGPFSTEATCAGGANTNEGPGAVAGRCYTQAEWQNIGTFDPTGIRTTFGPTAAGVFVEGRVIQTGGRGLANATIDLVDLSTGQRMLARSNSFGYFRFDDLEIGRIYTLTPSARRYTFPSGAYTFTLDDNMEGITFVGVLPTKESVKPPASKAVESVVAPEVPARKVIRTVFTTRKPGSDR